MITETISKAAGAIKNWADRFKSDSGDDFDSGKIATNVVSYEELPPADQPELVAKAVYALWVEDQKAFEPWWKASNLARNYYEGREKPNRASYKTNAMLNLIFSDIETIKPDIENVLVRPTLYATEQENLQGAEMLNMRTQNVWRDSNMHKEEASEIIHDTLMDGVVSFKVIYDRSMRGGRGDVRAMHIDNRRVTFRPGKQIHTSPYICDTVIGSVGEARRMFRKAKKMRGGNVEDLASKGMPKGPTGTDMPSGTAFINLNVPVPDVGEAAGTGVQKIHDMGASDVNPFPEAKSVARIECWFWDKTEDKDGNLLYPEGRIVTVGVGMDGDGGTTKKTPELMVLADRKNPYEQLAQKKGIFPFFQAQCHKVGREWGLSEVFHRIDPQVLINDVINTTHDNWKLTNGAPTLGLAAAGVTIETWKPAPDHFIELNGSVEDARKVIHRMEPIPIGHVSLPFLQAYTSLFERTGGAADALAGRKPEGVTAGYAITALQNRAKGRFTTIGKNINKTFVEVYYGIACCVQDFDTYYDQGYEEKPMTLISDDADPSDPAAKYMKYDPRMTAEMDFRTEVTRQMSLEEAGTLLNNAANLDKTGIPGMGELMLSYADDPSLRYKYIKLIQQAKAEAQAAAEQQMKAEADKQRREQVGKLTEKVVDAKLNAGRPNGSGSNNQSSRSGNGGSRERKRPGR